jgi:hypothetical protein
VIVFLLGMLIGLVLDRVWWESDLNKYEKGWKNSNITIGAYSLGLFLI